MKENIGRALGEVINSPQSTLPGLSEFKLPDVLTKFAKNNGKLKLFKAKEWEAFLDTMMIPATGKKDTVPWSNVRAAIAKALHEQFATMLWAQVKDAHDEESYAALEVLYLSRILDATERTAKRKDTAPLVKRLEARIKKLDAEGKQYFRNLFKQNASLAAKLGTKLDSVLSTLGATKKDIAAIKGSIKQLDEKVTAISRRTKRMEKTGVDTNRIVRKLAGKSSPKAETDAQLITAFYSYRKALAVQLSVVVLDGLGLKPEGAQQAPTLRAVYAALETATPVGREPKEETGRETLSAWDALMDKPARLSVFIGEPGSGKSTFIQFAALQLAEKGDRLPFRILLREFATFIGDRKGCPEAVLEFLENALHDDSKHDAAERLRELLTRGFATVFFDGLDEVPGPRVAAVRAAIESFAASGFPECRVTATCRVTSYEKKGSEFRLASFPEPHRIADLSQPLREKFIEAWYGEMHTRKFLSTKKEARELGSTLMNAIRASDDLQLMAGNPFFLTVMAVLHRSDDPLPDTAAKLMDTLVTGILAQSRKARDGVRAIVGDLPMLRQCLQDIAYQSREKRATAKATEDTALDEHVVKSLLLPAVGDDGKALPALIDDLRQRAGLIQSADGDTLVFAYRFEEFLAGCHLANNDAWEKEKQFDARAISLWQAQGDYSRKVIWWAAGFNAHVQQGSKGSVCDLIAALLAHATGHSERDFAALELAADIGRDARMSHWRYPATASGTLKALRERLEAIRDSREGNKIRSRAASAIGRLGDSRPGVGCKDGFPWFAWSPEIPGGEFVMGGLAGEDERTRTIAARYRISRYPVTVAQYAAFIAADGYKEDRWWPGEALAWRRDQKITGPEHYDEIYQTPNHPRVGVSWFEAKAFCSWLNSLGHAALGIEQGEEIRLATEAEWERAARGAERRPWPWAGEDENFAERCNSSPAGIGHTSAVGLFPSGNTPEGIADMSGNVWEWCEDYYDKSKTSRVVRGGSFFLSGHDLSPAYRFFVSAAYRGDLSGFRVVVSCSASARCVASE